MDSVERLGRHVGPGPAGATRVNPGPSARPVGPGQTAAGTPVSFGQMLADELAARATLNPVPSTSAPALSVPLQWSAHAQQRLRAGEIAWGRQQEQRLANAVEQVARKGGRQALVLLDDIAFIVSVPHRTVITAMDGQRRADNVFTQIDSAVIAR